MSIQSSEACYSPFTLIGSIDSVNGTSITALLPRASVGDLCWIETIHKKKLPAQVISFSGNRFFLAPFDEPFGVVPGARVSTKGERLRIKVSESLLGRVINPLGFPLDQAPMGVAHGEYRSLHHDPPPPASRPLISTPLLTGVRAIDGFTTLGRGQRIGICASAGVGKSTLLGMLAREAKADVTVVALVGERSREVHEFVTETLGEEGMKKCVVVVATSSDSSLMRQTAPYTATTIAEYFRDQGLSVLLIVDSLTRMARAIRETTLAAGELPVRHGYTNSVYTLLPKLLERAGTAPRGSISAVYTILTNTENDIDPLADEMKSLLDGHLVLSNELAQMGVLPPIDVTQSISRLAQRVTNNIHQQLSRELRRIFHRFFKEREIALLGGSPDAELQRVLARQGALLGLLSQRQDDVSTWEDTLHTMQGVLHAIKVENSNE